MELEIFTAKQLAGVGVGPREVARELATGKLIRLRRGVYRPGGQLDPTDAHRLQIAAARLVLPRGVVSHGSAAVLHGLPVPGSAIQRVSFTQSVRGRGHVSGSVHVRGCPLEADEITEIDGVPLTSLARTVSDLARELPFEWAVGVADAALRLGATRPELLDEVERARRRPGNRRARAVVTFADGRAESVGESRSLVIFARSLIAEPTLQHEVWCDGVLIGRSDFGWIDQRVLGEFDGRVKYGRSRLRDETAEDAVVREKMREDALGRENWLVVRWIWPDLDHPDMLVRRIRAALASGRDMAA